MHDLHPSPELRRTAWLHAAAAIVALASWLLAGCASLPQGASAVDAVDIEGTDRVSASDIEDKIATAPSPKFLGLFRGVIFDYELFDRFVLQRDLARVERFYRARGFYEARARAGRVATSSDNHVHVTIEVDEGEPILVRTVYLAGTEDIPRDVADAVRDASASQTKPTKIFDEEDFIKTDDAVKRALTDHGFAYAMTARRAEIDLPKHTADLYYEVFPGPPARLGAIRIEGLGDLPEAPVRRALDLKEGASYSTADIDSARQAVLDLGAFSNVTITPELPDPPPASPIVPLVVKLEESKLHQVTLGAGVEFDSIKTDLHLITGWESRNFLGGFRNFRVSFTPGVVLYPTRFQTPIKAPTDYLFEEKMRVELRQPGFIEARTGGIFSSEVNTYPLLLTPEQAQSPGPVLGYFEYKGSAGVDRTWWKLYASPSYNFQTNTPFAYLGDKDPDLSTIIISSIDIRATLDFRDDRIEPHKGLYILNDFQFAGLGGDARDIREQPDVRLYVPVAKKVTLALRGSVGFLFPFNYDEASLVENDRKEWVKDTQLIFLRGFFSGGSSSNRGYPLRGVGPHGIIPFYNPGLAYSQIANACDPSQPTSQDARCALPTGGFTLWEASAELRFPIAGPLTSATFCDSGDVSPKRVDIRLNRPHVSCGLGFRYATPVGPVRLDIGARIPGLNPNFEDDRVKAEEGNPGTIAGLPIALAFGIGEAF